MDRMVTIVSNLNRVIYRVNKRTFINLDFIVATLPD